MLTTILHRQARICNTRICEINTCGPCLSSESGAEDTGEEREDMELPQRRRSPTVRLRRLASELRQLRQAAKKGLKQVAEESGVNQATISRIEGAQVRPGWRTVTALLDCYGVTDEAARAKLKEWQSKSAQPGWLLQYEGELPEEYTAYMTLEADAAEVETFEVKIIPGLLQTEGYARHLLHNLLPGASVPDVEKRVEARMERQSLLTKDAPLKLWAIVDEGALRTLVGGPEIMAEQLRHLAEQARLPNVTLQVLPFGAGAHPGMHGAFVILRYPEPDYTPLVYIEGRNNAFFYDDQEEINRYSNAFQHLRAAALNPHDSERFLIKLASTMEQGGTG